MEQPLRSCWEQPSLSLTLLGPVLIHIFLPWSGSCTLNCLPVFLSVGINLELPKFAFMLDCISRRGMRWGNSGWAWWFWLGVEDCFPIKLGVSLLNKGVLAWQIPVTWGNKDCVQNASFRDPKRKIRDWNPETNLSDAGWNLEVNYSRWWQRHEEKCGDRKLYIGVGG